MFQKYQVNSKYVHGWFFVKYPNHADLTSDSSTVFLLLFSRQLRCHQTSFQPLELRLCRVFWEFVSECICRTVCLGIYGRFAQKMKNNLHLKRRVFMNFGCYIYILISVIRSVLKHMLRRATQRLFHLTHWKHWLRLHWTFHIIQPSYFIAYTAHSGEPKRCTNLIFKHSNF